MCVLYSQTKQTIRTNIQIYAFEVHWMYLNLNFMYVCIIKFIRTFRIHNSYVLVEHAYKQITTRNVYWNQKLKFSSLLCKQQESTSDYVFDFNFIWGLRFRLRFTWNCGRQRNELTFEWMHETMMALMALTLIWARELPWNYVISAVEWKKFSANNSNEKWLQ